MTGNKRFADPGASLSDIATHFIVCCPKCDGKSEIKAGENSFKLTCLQCFHVEKESHWYGDYTAYASVKCRECNAPIRRKANSDGQWKKLLLKCNECGDECEYTASLSKHYINNGLVCDPQFGLPLFLQQNFREDMFWAYNYEHLQLLEEFISAKHRERGITPRNTIRKNSSIVSRLPAFIQKAGNREELLKLIGILRKK